MDICDYYEIKQKGFGIKLNKDEFRFNSAHFLCSECDKEELHGHNYKVSLSLKGNQHLNKDGLVADFREVKGFVKQICNRLHTKTILPKNSSLLQIELEDGHYHIKIPAYSCRYVFPKQDVVLLELTNTSCEELSQYLMYQFLAVLPKDYLKQRGVNKVKIGVSESQGQTGFFFITI